MISRIFLRYFISIESSVLRRLSSVNTDISNTSSNEVGTAVKKQEEVFDKIFKGIVGETNDFYIVDKPANLSLYRSLPLKNLKYNGISSEFTIDDILPLLCKKLKRPDGSLHISTELPYQYSGLFILSKNKRHHDICRKFYEKHSIQLYPGYPNQSYRCLCWNRPAVPKLDPSPFTYTYLQRDHDNPQYGIPNKIEGPLKKYFGQKKVWTKQIGHEVVSEESHVPESSALVDVSCNSTYRGVIPLYLLYQGSIIVGEYLQASRLSPSRLGHHGYILPPEKADPSRPLPLELRVKLGPLIDDLSSTPILVHCHKLLVPAVRRDTKTAEYLTKSPFDFNSNESVHLSWDSELRVNVVAYYSVPEYFRNVMKQLKVPFPFNDLHYR